jgi:hypothetical protein
MFGSVATAAAQYQGTDITIGSKKSPAHLRVSGLTVTYRDEKHPDLNFTLTCDDFAARASDFEKGLHVKLGSGFKGNLWLRDADNDTFMNRYNHKIPGMKEEILADCAAARDAALSATLEAEAQAQAASARHAEEANRNRGVALANELRTDIIAAWRAADEADSFASIRGEFDLSSPTAAWKTVHLPYADRCVLLKAPGASSGTAPQWTFYCHFPAGSSSQSSLYDGVVHAVKSAVNLDYQPDETAMNVNQVFFSDSSKPAWRLIVTKLNDSSVELRITQRPVNAVAPFSESVAQAGPSIHDETEGIRIGPHGQMPPAQCSSTGGTAWGTTTMSVQNSTAYQLTVLWDGPVSRKLVLDPGASQTVDLTSGTYHVAGRVAAADVLPYYGEESYQGSASCSDTFYITPR